jgi:predicted ATPase/DNA-binding winged helix-turn-helix (wHTH) protein
MSSPVHRFGRFEIRALDRLLLKEGEPVQLGARAFDVLLTLIERNQRLVTKEELFQEVWKGQSVGESNLHTQVSTLRTLLGPGAIATVAGRGYRFAVPLLSSTDTLNLEFSALGHEVQQLQKPSNPVAAAASGEPQLGPADASALWPLDGESIITFGNVEIRAVERVVFVDGKPAALGSRALDVLLALVAHRGKLVTKGAILDRVWSGLFVEENNLQTQVSALRKVLGQQAITTVPGIGYRFALGVNGKPSGTAAASSPLNPLSTEAPEHRPRLSNLTLISEALCGRAQALDNLSEWLARHRLITVVGAGGIGKTCLAQAAARSAWKRFEDGVWWVDLASIAEPSKIAVAIAHAAGVRLAEGDETELLAQALEHREMLLLLDNCEHLVQGVARVVDAVLKQALRVTFLATSQESLKLHDERVFRLEALAVPVRGIGLDKARSYGAVQLLEQRVQALDRHFVLDDGNVDKAINLCQQLDGIALAIEMAAARLPSLGFDGLEANLGQRLRLLKSNRRTAPQRQQTLHATLHWSYALLNADEQAVLRCLGVFAGSFQLGTAQSLSKASGRDDWTVLDALSALIDRSLVQIEQAEPPRYRMLETTRLFVRERSTELGETELFACRHGLAMSELAREVEGSYWSSPDDQWLSRFEPDYADLELAFERACVQGDATVGGVTLEALFWLDLLRAMQMQLQLRVKAASRLLASAVKVEDRARLLLHLSYPESTPSTTSISSRQERLAMSEEAAQLFEELDDKPRQYQALLHMATLLSIDAAASDADRAIAAARSVEDRNWPPRLLWLGAHFEGRTRAFLGDWQLYRLRTRDSLKFAEMAGSPCQAVNARLNLADAALMAGDWGESVQLGETAVRELEYLGLDMLLAVARINLCAAHLRRRALSDARAAAQLALPAVWKAKLYGPFACHLAALAAESGEFEAAARTCGFIDAWVAREQPGIEPSERLSLELARKQAVASLSPSTWELHRSLGAALNPIEFRILCEAVVQGHSARRTDVAISAVEHPATPGGGQRVRVNQR